MAYIRLLLVALAFTIYTVSSYTITEAQKTLILKAHNDVRRSWGVTNDLVWDNTIASGAQAYTDGCVYGHSNTDLGENIGYQGSSDKKTPFPFIPVTTTVDDWNSEVSQWKCSSNSCSGTCGHFTQVVWKATTKIGCGISECTFSGFRSQYLVCRYSPAGNYNNQHPLNAPSSSSVCPGTIPPPPPTSTGTVPPPPTTGSNPPPPTTGSNPPPPPTTGSNPPPPPTTGSSTGHAGCKVSCNGVQTTCKATPTYISGKVYCQCGDPSGYSWTVSNAGTSACNFWPPGVPLPLAFDRCMANFNGASTACTGAPSKYNDGKMYCPCGDPAGYSWPVKNLNSADCPYTAAAMDEAGVSDTSSASTLSTGQWVGICIGIVIVALIVIIIVVVTMKKRREELI